MSHETADETVEDRFTWSALPLDLLAVVGYVAVAVALLSRPGVYGTPLAVALGLPLLLFAPGYALVSLLFPGAAPDDAPVEQPLTERELGDRTPTDRRPGDQPSTGRRHGLAGSERVALGFGISVALLPILGIALALSPWSIDPNAVLVSVSGTAVCFAVVGSIRRLRRPADRRFSIPIRAWLDDARRTLSAGSPADAVLNVALAVAVVAAVAAIGFAVAAPGPGQSYTSVTLLSKNETGELVTGDYPRTFESGESKPLVVAVTNHEDERTRYSVVASLQRVRQADDGSAKVLEDHRLATFTPTVAPDETWQTTHDVTPGMTGEDLRLVYLVYRGDPPTEPTTDNAYRHVHVWVNVTA